MMMSLTKWIVVVLLAVSLGYAVSRCTDAHAAKRLDHSAAAYVGKNPTGWARQWCAKFVDMVLRKNGHAGGGNLSRAYANYRRGTKCKPGSIAVMATHIGFVSACHTDSVTIVSGNHAGSPGRRTVGYGRYPRSRIIAFRMP